jgi:hypothetical protein
MERQGHLCSFGASKLGFFDLIELIDAKILHHLKRAPILDRYVVPEECQRETITIEFAAVPSATI